MLNSRETPTNKADFAGSTLYFSVQETESRKLTSRHVLSATGIGKSIWQYGITCE
jgi:hypothetical protein